GGLPRETIEQALGQALIDGARLAATDADVDAPLAPGMLAPHYPPPAVLRLAVRNVDPGEALLAFGSDLPPGADQAPAMRNLSPTGDLIEAAANLFSDLR